MCFFIFQGNKFDHSRTIFNCNMHYNTQFQHFLLYFYFAAYTFGIDAYGVFWVMRF